MKKIMIFCIPAHGHTNPILPVAQELVSRGDAVKFYSFDEFREKIERTGAEFVSCDRFLAKLSRQEEENIKNVNTTEMSIQDIRITINLSEFLDSEFNSFQPDVVYSDSACFWGKLSAWKHNIPLVVSTSTFAFNQMSSQYMKNSSKEVSSLLFGLPRVQKEFRRLREYGYEAKSFLSLVQSDNATDSVVYTSKRFQPYAESFSDRYAFVGPSVFSVKQPQKQARPLVYISLGTVINERPDFYLNCIEALKNESVDVVISCGKAVDISTLGVLPDNVKVYPYVDQLDILAKTSVFITHCGMNSVSESLYMATPMVLFPQTNEQQAVARRVTEIGAGTLLKDDSAAGIRTAVTEILSSKSYAEAAEQCCADFRSCSGAKGAADHIENAPNPSDGKDVIRELNKAVVTEQILYNVISVILASILFRFVRASYLWIYIAAVILLSAPIKNVFQEAHYKKLTTR
ncbi:MAG: glycosyl transferase [Oscillospiraceae bacterium]|nr:glycosyl transferase [Oscillospiraceae bacterium]